MLAKRHINTFARTLVSATEKGYEGTVPQSAHYEWHQALLCPTYGSNEANGKVSLHTSNVCGYSPMTMDSHHLQQNLHFVGSPPRFQGIVHFIIITPAP